MTTRTLRLAASVEGRDEWLRRRLGEFVQIIKLDPAPSEEAIPLRTGRFRGGDALSGDRTRVVRALLKPDSMQTESCRLVVAASCLTLGVTLSVAAQRGPAQPIQPPPAARPAAGPPPQAQPPRAQRTRDDAEAFSDRWNEERGLGPVFNRRACAECHDTPSLGGGSTVTVLRAGHFDGQVFVEHPGGSLIQDRAVDPSIEESVLPGNEVRARRISLSTLGDGYVEALDDRTLEALAAAQPEGMRGEIIRVPVLEAPGALRVGRFGWKNQHASLLSFSADAFLNEMGITNRLLLTENTSNGAPVAAFDRVPDTPPDGEDAANDLDRFARFMRGTAPPEPDADLSVTPAALAGSSLFDNLGCATCHVRSLTTAPAGTVLNGGTFTVPAELGGVTIHPFSDFLLHDVDTGDGIVQNGGPGTRNRLRTTPLWGLRHRARLLHDGSADDADAAIRRHGGEARQVTRFYQQLDGDQQAALLAFLRSL